MSKSVPNFCLLFLAFVAVAWAQVVGLNHHYVCLCTGEPMEVIADHCHDHGAQVVSDFDDSHQHHEGHEDSVPHTPLKKELKGQKHTATSPTVQAPEPVMLFDLPEFARPVLSLSNAHDGENLSPLPQDSPGGFSTALLVKESMVLLI